VLLFNGFKKDFFEAQYARGLSVLTDKSKRLKSGECEGHTRTTGPVLPVQLSRQVLMITSLTGLLKCAGAPLCINSVPTADTFLDCTSKTWWNYIDMNISPSFFWKTHPKICPGISDTPVYSQIVERERERAREITNSNRDLKYEFIINVWTILTTSWLYGAPKM